MASRFNKTKFRYFILILSSFTLIIPIIFLIISLNLNSQNLVFANFQSYMSPIVKKELSKKYGLTYDYFETSENSKKLLINNSADIVTTTTYESISWIKEGLVQKLDWSKFDIKDKDISNANDALQLFIPVAQEILQGYVSDKFNLLEYGIPYFLQDLVFVYRGKEIGDLKKEEEPDWKITLEAIINEPRFTPKNNIPNLMAIDDPRTIYSIPKVMENHNSDISIDPQPNSSLNSLETTFDFLNKELNKIKGNNIISFNSDSNTILNKIAKKEIFGAFIFNGDAIFASQGGDEDKAPLPGDFHVVRPTDNVKAMDIIVLDNDLKGTNLENAYKIINDLTFNFDYKKKNSLNLTLENFKYLGYTPATKSLYEEIITNYNDFPKEMLEMPMPISKLLFEKPIDNLTKSNFIFAWINFKNKVK